MARPLLPLVRSMAAAACMTALAAPASAQIGNLLFLSNGVDTLYGGVGAGGGQVAGVDGMGQWIPGEQIRGNTLTNLGDFGYREVAWTEEVCVLGPPIPGLKISFPGMLVMEHAGGNAHQPFVFTNPLCTSAGSLGLTSAGFAPYMPPPGSSDAFLSLPFASASGIPSALSPIVPNTGLLPSSNGGQITIIAGVGDISLPIASTGFCWGVEFNWVPSALPSLDDITGWYRWRTNSADGNQYWGLSNDERNIWQSNTIVSDAGKTAVTAFFANVDYAGNSRSRDPVTVAAVAPTSPSAGTPWSTTGLGVPFSGDSVNGGFDLGRIGALSLSGTLGATNPTTGLGNQDPAGAVIAGLTPTLGFVTTGGDESGAGGLRLTWVAFDFALTFGLPPQASTDVPLAFGQSRVPVPIDTFVSLPFPQPITNQLLPLLVHQTGFVAGSGGTWGQAGGPIGSSIHLPVASATSMCIGLPIGITFGTSALGGPTGPVVWSPSVGRPSNSGQLILVD